MLLNEVCHLILKQDPGKFINEKVIILNPKMQAILVERGFGESEKNTLILDSFETLYLLYNNKLELKKVNKIIVFDELLQKYIQKNDDILTQFYSIETYELKDML